MVIGQNLIHPLIIFLDDINPADVHSLVMLLVGGTGGGVLFKMYNAWITKKKLDTSTETAYRNELRQDVESLKSELVRVNQKLEEQTAQYYHLLEEHTILKAEYQQNKKQLDLLRKRLELSDKSHIS